jgi:hypothetical protein
LRDSFATYPRLLFCRGQVSPRHDIAVFLPVQRQTGLSKLQGWRIIHAAAERVIGGCWISGPHWDGRPRRFWFLLLKVNNGYIDLLAKANDSAHAAKTHAIVKKMSALICRRLPRHDTGQQTTASHDQQHERLE